MVNECALDPTPALTEYMHDQDRRSDDPRTYCDAMLHAGAAQSVRPALDSEEVEAPLAVVVMNDAVVPPAP